MKQAFLVSKTLGLRLLETFDLDGALVLHPDDTKDARSALYRFRELAEERGFDLRVVSGQKDVAKALGSYQPDIALVCGWYQLLGPEILAIPRLGCWGIHNSLLPKYRGGAPLVWSIINGDAEVGSTVFKLTEGMDDGPILHQVRVTLGENDTIADALARIEQGLIADLAAKLATLADGSAQLIEQDEAQATYCGQRKPDDGQIDWTRPAREVHNFIRAQVHPYPGAHSWRGPRMIRFERSEVDPRICDGTPGQVLMRGPGYAIVACGGRTAIRLATDELKSVNDRLQGAPHLLTVDI